MIREQTVYSRGREGYRFAGDVPVCGGGAVAAVGDEGGGVGRGEVPRDVEGGAGFGERGAGRPAEGGGVLSGDAEGAVLGGGDVGDAGGWRRDVLAGHAGGQGGACVSVF